MAADGPRVDDREKLFAHLDRVTRAAPDLIERARDVLERSITFQQDRFAEYMSRADGKRELEARAFAEYQKTKRTEAGYAFLGDVMASIAVVWPTVQDVIGTFTGKPAQSLPKFECSQQAMAYLSLSLEPERIATMIPGDVDADKLDKARDMIKLLDVYSRMRDEREMLAKAEPLIRNVLTRSAFRAVVLPEQVIAVQYISGRAAIFRVVEEEYGGGA